jgi:hypothetical protein
MGLGFGIGAMAWDMDGNLMESKTGDLDYESCILDLFLLDFPQRDFN